jgi:hypothetical protein
MSKELEYEFNNFANLLHKDCMNLMECLKKQSEDNKPILYLGKHYEKVILPYEEYQKMCNRLESIDNANPSEALECLDKIAKQIELDEDTDYWEIRNAHKTVENALLKAQKEHKALEIIKPSLRLVGNCLQAKAPFVDDYHPWVFIKEITDEEELKLLRRMLE